jgi:leucyl aminopeptidase (aminopeptidase T)
MNSHLYWEQFAEATIRKLVRPEPGDSLLILADDSTDVALAETCFAAGIRAGADTQLLYFKRVASGAPSNPGPIMSNAILNARLILSLCLGTIRTPATLQARANGTRVLNTVVTGIEDYVVRALLDVDYDAMIRNAERMAKLFEQTKVCRTTSPEGTDLTCEFAPRPAIVGDGALTEDGEVDFYPGAQVSIAPVEETINGTIVVDASDGVQGVVNTPYSMIVENGVVTRLEGGKEANAMRVWLETRNDPDIYRLCHYSIGLNPQAGISGNLIEDERMLGSLDLGFGYQDPKFEGSVGSTSPYHQDIMIASPRVELDGVVLCEGNKLNPDLGFEKM